MFRLRTFGTFGLIDPAGGNTPLPPHRLALLALVAAAGDRGIARDKLLAYLWPDSTPVKARASLEQMLHALRVSLGDRSALLGNPVRLEPSAVSSDVAEFRRTIDAGDLERAVALYAGPFLDGFYLSGIPEFEQWLTAERSRLEAQYVSAIEKLAVQAAAHREHVRAIEWIQALGTVALPTTAATRRFIDALVAAGDRDAALEYVALYSGRVRAELGAELDPGIAALAEELRRGTPAAGMQTPGFATAEQVGRARAQGAGRVTERRVPRRAAVIGVAAVVVMLAAGYALAGRRGSAAESDPVSDLPQVAVLPFENLGPTADDYFADGITEEITNRLAGLSGLAVMSPQSAMQFKGTTKSTAEIGRELGVQYLLRGRIRWQRQTGGQSRVRVTPRLIRVSDDRLLWADEFEEVLVDIFRVQGQIATQVAGALGVTLLSREQAVAGARPTRDSAAYEYYLRGNAHFRAGYPVAPPLRDAVEMYQRAVDLDPAFASAHARLSVSHGGIHRGGLDPRRADEHLALLREHAGRALALDSGLAEAHWAMGWYQMQGRRDYEAALGEFAIALEAEPNNILFLGAKAAILKRTGDFAASAELNARASDLDPLSWSPAVEAYIGYSFTRQFAKAQHYIDRSASGSVQPGEGWLSVFNRVAGGEDASVLRSDLTAKRGEAGLMRVVARAALGPQFGAPGRALVRILCGPCDAAIPLVPSLLEPGERDSQRYAGLALLHERAGRREFALAYYDSARAIAESFGQSGSAIWLAKLGRKDAAVTIAEKQLSEARRNRDVLAERGQILTLLEVYVTLREHEAALERMEWLLSRPSGLSVGLLKADPLYDPLRNDPRFQALLTKYGAVAPR